MKPLLNRVYYSTSFQAFPTFFTLHCDENWNSPTVFMITIFSSTWVTAISAKRKSMPQKLVELKQQLQMPLIEVWIAALLEGFQLDQRGEFYETDKVWLS